MALHLAAKESLWVNSAPPSPKQPRFLEGKKEVVPISPIVPALNFLPSEKVYSARLKAANYYDKAFSDCKQLETPYRTEQSSHVFHQYTLKLNPSINREELIAYMNNKGIPVKVYYPIPLHSFDPYKQSIDREDQFAVSDNLCSTVISLPMHTELDDETLAYISSSLLAFVIGK